MSICLTTKKSNCKDCYKCIRNCPVKAIGFTANQAYINYEECVLCGRCVVYCPQNAKQITDDTDKITKLLSENEQTIASLDPSFVANYSGAGIGALREALKKLGFYDAEETAIGATIVKKEYERILKDEQRDIVISSACPSVNLLIQKHFPQLLPYLADVISPMQAHCMDIKRRYPEAKTVFIGPCIAAKDAAKGCRDAVDAAITFGELSKLLRQADIEIQGIADSEEKSKARLGAIEGGIIKTMNNTTDRYTYISVDGLDNCIAALSDIQNNNVHNCFIEMSACNGGCIGSPAMEKKYLSRMVEDRLTVVKYAGKKDFEVEQPEQSKLKKEFKASEKKGALPTEAQIQNVLAQMGRAEPSRQFNCGICGYNTCRQKAIAVCQGRADISMCLPVIKDKSQSFSDSIIKNFPDGIIVLNEQLEVCQINEAARKILNINSATEILSGPVLRILDPKVFMNVLENKRSVRNERVYLDRYKRFVERTVIYDKPSRLLVGIMRDITDEENERENRENINREAVKAADEVIERQLRTVQEIASLLGETAAENKILLTKLKESLSDE